MEHSLGHLQRRSSEWNVGAETEWTEAGGGKEGDQGAQSQGRPERGWERGKVRS